MRSRARVVATDGEYATVLCDRKSACEGCHKPAEGADCSVCSLMGSGKAMQTRAYNAAHAQVGDVVEIETRTSRVLGYAAAVFLLPVLMVILGYWIAGLWTDIDAWRYMLAGILFVLTFIGIRIYSEKKQKKKTDVTVVSVVDPNESSEEEF